MATHLLGPHQALAWISKVPCDLARVNLAGGKSLVCFGSEARHSQPLVLWIWPWELMETLRLLRFRSLWFCFHMICFCASVRQRQKVRVLEFQRRLFWFRLERMSVWAKEILTGSVFSSQNNFLTLVEILAISLPLDLGNGLLGALLIKKCLDLLQKNLARVASG